MENSYGIGVTNRYEIFLDDESDPLESIKIKEQEKELKKKTKVAEKENKGKPEAPNKVKIQTAKKTAKDATNKVQDTKREEGKPTNQRSNFNENREERNNRRNREDRPLNGGNFENNRDRDREDRPRREQTDSFESRRGRPAGTKPMNRGGVGGAGGSGGERPRRQFDDRRGKREFDRQSGSDKTHGYRGVKPIDKRDGGGAHNWGSHKDVIEEADNGKTTDNDQVWNENEKIEAPVIPTATTTETTKENEPEAETPVEEEPRELTLDEWKAQRAGRQKPTYNLRKAGEGEDLTQWKKMYQLNKKKEGEEESDDDEYDVSEYPQRVGRQKRVVGIDFQFYDSKRGGPGRGRGARTGRGGRPNRDARSDKPGPINRFRDEPRDERNDVRNAPKVDDERDFPSLG